MERQHKLTEQESYFS